jgi:hypothetical protein
MQCSRCSLLRARLLSLLFGLALWRRTKWLREIGAGCGSARKRMPRSSFAPSEVLRIQFSNSPGLCPVGVPFLRGGLGLLGARGHVGLGERFCQKECRTDQRKPRTKYLSPFKENRVKNSAFSGFARKADKSVPGRESVLLRD